MIRTAAALMLTILTCSALAAQPAGDGKAELVNEMIALTASYPKTLREPILKVAEHWELLAKLGKGDKVDALLAAQPKPVQDALRQLAKYPEVLKTLGEDAASMAALGKAYQANPAKLLERINEQADIESKSADEWSKRLGQDADAIEQMTAALKAYQQQANVNAEDAASEAGVTTAANTINVNALPSPGFANYIMNNADVYPALADTMVSQWLNTRNSWAFDHNFHRWWSRYHTHFDENQFFRADEHRADRLADIARYDRKYAKDDKRWDKFDDHRKEYDHLAKVDRAAKDHRFEPGRKPHSKDGTERKPRRKPEAGKHPEVKRSHFAEHHHAHHAAASHHHAASHHRR